MHKKCTRCSRVLVVTELFITVVNDGVLARYQIICLLQSGVRCNRNLVCDQLLILFLLLQEEAPYNKGAFKIEINFPAEYPFKPPKITFVTSIYHPNIDEKGQVRGTLFLLGQYLVLFNQR